MSNYEHVLRVTVNYSNGNHDIAEEIKNEISITVRDVEAELRGLKSGNHKRSIKIVVLHSNGFNGVLEKICMAVDRVKQKVKEIGLSKDGEEVDDWIRIVFKPMRREVGDVKRPLCHLRRPKRVYQGHGLSYV